MINEYTRERTVNGMVVVMVGDKGRISPAPITVRLTVDKHGKSLSLAFDEVGAMYMIPLEPVSDMLRVVPEGESAQPEVIRCKDCKNCDKIDDYEYWCDGRGFPRGLVTPDGFCDKGAKREGEE